ncbi:hypothetical protein [Halosimplex halobium]|uniref:hypothetical protein n=1 Tax=Halosimplex halobium TaxID=3396618 RepID=UPI003F57F37E
MTGADSVAVTADEPGRAVARTGAFAVTVDPDDDCVEIRRRPDDGGSAPGGTLTLSPGGPDDGPLSAGSVAQVTTRTDAGDVRVTVEGTLDGAPYTLSLVLPSDYPGTLSYEVTMGADDAAALPTAGWDPELGVRGATGDADADAFTSYLDGTPGSNPAAGTSDLNQFVYAGVDALDATCLYLADWPALDEYFRRTGTTMRGTVTDSAERVGYVPPDPSDAPSGDSPGDDPLTVHGATLVLTPDAPPVDAPDAYCDRFVTDLAAIYDRLDRPDPERVDWPAVSEDTLDAVRAPENRYEYDGQFHPGGVELVTVLSIVTPFRAYAERFDDDAAADLAADVASLVETYYDPDYEDAAGNTGMIGNSPAPLTLTHVDAWYLFWPVVQAAEFAIAFDDDAVAEMVVDTADVMVAVGRALDYEFPMWLDVDSLSGHEPDDRQWDGYQYDCTGAYAYLMLQYHELTGEQRYVEEAEAAAEQLLDYGFELPYEFTTTPLTPLAMARLADRTDDDRYVEASYIGLANVLRHAYFFDPEYGSFAGRNVFLLNEAMPPEGYEGNFFANALEEWSLLYYLDRYLREAGDALTPEARRLTGELLRHKGSSLADSLARFQPDTSLVFDGVSPQSGRRVNHDWALPLEPFGALEPMFETLGAVGQDLYGAGAYPEVATQQYYPLDDGVRLFVDGPTTVERVDDHTWHVTTLGAEETYDARLSGETSTLVDWSVRRLDPSDGGERLGEDVTAQFDHDADEPAYDLALDAGDTFVVRRTVPKRAIVVEDFAVERERIATDERTTVSLTVVNTAGVEGTYEVPLSVGAETVTRTVALPAHGRVPVTFEIGPDEPGTYNVQIAHENRALHVEPATD